MYITYATGSSRLGTQEAAEMNQCYHLHTVPVFQHVCISSSHWMQKCLKGRGALWSDNNARWQVQTEVGSLCSTEIKGIVLVKLGLFGKLYMTAAVCWLSRPQWNPEIENVTVFIKSCGRCSLEEHPNGSRWRVLRRYFSLNLVNGKNSCKKKRSKSGDMRRDDYNIIDGRSMAPWSP